MICIILTVLLSLALFSIFAILLKLPKLSADFSALSKRKDKKHGNPLDLFAKQIAKYIPISELKQAELQKELSAAGSALSPREYFSDVLVYTAIPLLAGLLLLIISPWLSLLAVGVAVFVYVSKRQAISKQAEERSRKIGKELPKFISYVSRRCRTDHNLLDIIDGYKQNYQNELTEELAITAADMRTGNQEQAIQRMQNRVNTPLMTELSRGLISAMRGDDVTAYFDSLNRKIGTMWEQELHLKVLKKQPKITRMSGVMVGCALISTFAIMIFYLLSALSVLGV